MAKEARLEMPDDEEDGEIVSLEEGGKVEDKKKPADEPDNADHGDEDGAGEVADTGDARLAHGEDDPDREKFREARRQQRRDRKKHRKIVSEQRDRELAEMRAELATLRTAQQQTQQGVHGQTAAMVDQRLADVNAAIRLSEEAMAKAMKEQNAEAFTNALNTRDNAKQAQIQLGAYKQALANPQNQQQQPKQAAIDPRMQRHFADFCADNPWFQADPTNADDDSKSVFRLDASVKAAGYDPNTPEYWEELQDRVDRKFPKKIGAGGDEEEDARPTGRRGPNLGGSRSQGRALGKNEVYVPAALKAAMISNGSWSDPKKRASILKRHKEAVDRQKNLPR